MSPIAKSVEGFPSVIETVEVSPIPMLAGLGLPIVVVGATVSMVIAVARAPARFLLVSASSNVSLATEICPGVVESAVGVKITEYVDPLPEKPESAPPVAVMSASVKSTESAESTNEMTAVSSLPSVVALDVIATVGAVGVYGE